MQRPLRVGIAGASAEGPGWAPLSHLPALQKLSDRYEIAAVCTTRAETAAAAAAKYGAGRAFHDYRAMVADPDIDLVSVVVKAPSHHPVVMAALAAGKHVYCEWPLGANLAEAEEMATLARTKQVRAMVGLQARGDPALRYLKTLIADGYAGDIVAVNMTMFTGGVLERPASRLWDRDRKQGISALTVRGIHTLDALCFCLGELAEVSARVTTQVKQWRVDGTGAMVDVDAPDNVALTGVLEGGALVSAHIATLPHNGSGFRMEIYGRDGTIRVTSKGAPQRDANLLMGAKGAAPLEVLPVPAHFTTMPADTPAGPPQNVGHLYLRMADAIRDGTPVEPDFDLGVRRHRLIDAIERSSDTGRPVRIS